MISNMQAVILAAGRGRRLAPLTDTTPKPLIEVQGVPLLKRLLSSLPKQITEVIIVTEYLEEKIQEEIGRAWNNISITYVSQGEYKGTLGALMAARDKIVDEPFLVMGSDDLFEAEELDSIAREKLAFGVHKKFLPGKEWLIIETDKTGRVISMRKPSDEEFREPQFMATGVYLLDKSIFEVPPYVLPNGELGLPQTLRPLFATKSFIAIEMKEWLQVNTHEELAYANQYLGKKHI
jgi:NDP-sugar pyrophosphorylase family protein